MVIHEILKKYWGFTHFRPLQEDIINSVLANNDTLALLPTGGGKSICFQVAALAKDGICLVISPLIALMKDQLENLKQKGIPALAIYTGMSFLETKKTLQNAAFGNFKFLYVSPERLETKLFLEFLHAIDINLIAVDEAHCISQWGYDFRPTYLRIANLRDLLPGVPVLALTASATKIVQEDICQKLQPTINKQNEWQKFKQSFERRNLSYSVFNVPSKQNKVLEILKNVPGSAIIYCKSRKNTKEVAGLLQLNGVNADFYHAGLSNQERNQKQDSWIKNNTRVIACTNAFGMGIDKPDVKVVIHYDVPECLENYYQEAGRAGRDGKRAYAVLLYTNLELESLQNQSSIRFPSEAQVKKVYIDIMNHLQVAAGGGEGMSFDFEIAGFTTAFKLNILTTSNSIKVLEQEGVISYNEIFFRPSTVVFTTNKEDLEDFEKQHPDLNYLIKGLLRSYEGILDYPATVFENKLSKFTGTNLVDLKQGLKKLHDYGIISYSPQSEKPQITLLKNRMYADDYLIDMKDFHRRKVYFEDRVKAIGDYINQDFNCRSVHIAQYFSDLKIAACGICDICINKKNINISTTEFKIISQQVLFLINQRPFKMNELFIRIPEIKKEKIWRVIEYMLAENKIASDTEGNIKKY